MRNRSLAILLLIGLVAPSCREGTENRAAHVENHSFARVDEAVMTHVDLDLEIDFEAEKISGSASIHFTNNTGTNRLVLDTRDLHINRVTLGEGGTETTFRLGETVEHLGTPLIIDIGPDTRVANVFYETTDGATAVDWLKPSQTTGGKSPFLFTQGQAILNRTWIPLQDNTAIRITYRAKIQVPPGTMAVMSARNGTEKNPDGVYEFYMPQPIPPYLIALAVGDLEFRPISDRVGVYAEPGVVEKAAWEFADTESMMREAEALYGPYRWERYDIIVLPPSFPYGGMENPRLSFVTPVLLAGDRSLVATVAHELAHSWSGNLVTNATWNDFWLNEGFTTYFERRILEAVYGKEYAEMDAVLGRRNLDGDLEELGADSPDTHLHLDLWGRDPDEGGSWVAYEKGYLFLRMMEEAVGREKWDGFLREYFDTFAFQTMTTARFVGFVEQKLIGDDADLEKRIALEDWVYGPGLPSNEPKLQSSAFDRVLTQVESWKNGTAAVDLATSDWSSQEWKQFVQKLPAKMTADQMGELDGAFHFSAQANGEIRQVWFLHAIENGYESAYPELDAYLVGIGRIWLISPLYRKLAETPEGLEMAMDIYRRARPGYHPLTASIVDRTLNWTN